MGKIGQRLVFEVISTHAEKRSEHHIARYAVLRSRGDGISPHALLTGDTSEGDNLRWHVPTDEAMPEIGSQMVFVGGPGLDDCIAKATAIMPLFTVLPTDELAPDVVRDWVVRMLHAHGRMPSGASRGGWGSAEQARSVEMVETIRAAVMDLEEGKLRAKLSEALDQADAMEAWPVRKLPGRA